MKSLVMFIVGALLFGGGAVAIGHAVGGDEILLPSGVAFALAFIPAAATFAWVTASYRSTPEMRLTASLGSSGVRMVIALGGGYYLTTARPQAFDGSFWFWLLLFYLTLLAFEITLLVRGQTDWNGSPQS